MGKFSENLYKYATTIDSEQIDEGFESIINALKIKPKPKNIEEEWVDLGLSPQINLSNIDGTKIFIFGGWEELKKSISGYTSGSRCPINPYYRLFGVSTSKDFKLTKSTSATTISMSKENSLDYNGIDNSSPYNAVAYVIKTAIETKDGMVSSDDLIDIDRDIYNQYVASNFAELCDEYDKRVLAVDPSATPKPKDVTEALKLFPYKNDSLTKKVTSQSFYRLTENIKSTKGDVQQQINYMANPQKTYVNKFSKQKDFNRSVSSKTLKTNNSNFNLKSFLSVGDKAWGDLMSQRVRGTP